MTKGFVRFAHEQKSGVGSFIIVSSIQTNSIVVGSIFAPVTAIGDVIERACEFESQRPCHNLNTDQYMIMKDLTKCCSVNQFWRLESARKSLIYMGKFLLTEQY